MTKRVFFVLTVDVESPTQSFTDGLWHSFSLYMDSTKVNVTVDRNVKVSERTMAFQPGTEYSLGKSHLNLTASKIKIEI